MSFQVKRESWSKAQDMDIYGMLVEQEVVSNE